MLPHLYRTLCASCAVLALLAAPCFAQPPPPPPPDDAGPSPVNFEQPEPAVDPIYRAWDLLSQPPPPLHSGGFPQPTLWAPMYRVTWFPTANVPNQSTNITAVREDFSVGVPLYKGDWGLLGLTTSVHNEILDTHAVLPA